MYLIDHFRRGCLAVLLGGGAVAGYTELVPAPCCAAVQEAATQEPARLDKPLTVRQEAMRWALGIGVLYPTLIGGMQWSAGRWLHGTGAYREAWRGLAATAGFLSLFQVLKDAIPQGSLTPKDHRKLCSNVVSMTHATLIASLSIAKLAGWHWASTLFVQGMWLVRGYCLMDIITDLVYQEFDLLNVYLHHSALLYVSFLTGDYERQLAWGLLSELTNLPLYTTWYLIKTDRQHTRAYQYAAGTTLVSFFFLRIVMFTGLFLRHYATVPVSAVGFFGLITGMNYYWYYKLLQKGYQSFVLSQRVTVP